jgi:signal transduction histidine kinase
LSSFKRQESTFIVINLFILAVLLLIQSLFSSYLGTPSPVLVAVLGLGFLLQALELIWLQSVSSLSATRVLALTWCSIVLNMALAFALASLTDRRDAQYFALMALPVVQAAFRLRAVPTAIVIASACALNIYWVWHFFHLHPPFVLGEYIEAGTVSLIYLMVGVLVWLLVNHLRSTQRSLEQSLAELQHARARLLAEEKLAAVGRLSSAIAHEIRNPVAMISSALDMALKSTSKPADRQEMFEIAAKESNRLVALTTDFLAYARPRPPDKRSSDAFESIAYVADLCRPHAETNHVGIRVEAEEGLQAEIDSGQVQQALLNMVKNAIEASAPEGVVVLKGSRENEQIRIDVQNANGPIPNGMVEQIFEPFVTTKATGSGLGLAIARNIARAHGGELSLSCNQADAVRFSILLPGCTSEVQHA